MITRIKARVVSGILTSRFTENIAIAWGQTFLVGGVIRRAVVATTGLVIGAAARFTGPPGSRAGRHRCSCGLPHRAKHHGQEDGQRHQ